MYALKKGLLWTYYACMRSTNIYSLFTLILVVTGVERDQKIRKKKKKLSQ